MKIATHIMLSWTSWRKQLFLSYIQLVQSRADVRGRGLQRAVVLTLSSRGSKLHIVVALRQQTSCSITIKTRNKKKKQKHIYPGRSVSAVAPQSFHVCWLADARARCSAATRHTGTEVFICGQRWCLFVSVAHQAARRLVHIPLDKSPLPLCRIG